MVGTSVGLYLLVVDVGLHVWNGHAKYICPLACKSIVEYAALGWVAATSAKHSSSLPHPETFSWAYIRLRKFVPANSSAKMPSAFH